jgi:hypothetical protein
VRVTVRPVLWLLAIAIGFAARAVRVELVVVVFAGARSGVATVASGAVVLSTLGAGVALTVGCVAAGCVAVVVGRAGASWANAWVEESARAAAIAGRALVHV